MLWLSVNIADNASFTKAINSKAKAGSKLAATAVTGAYAIAAADPFLGKWQCL